MPSRYYEVDLSSASPTEVVAQGNVALSLLITSCTVGVAFEVRLGTSGDWIGPFVGVGDWPMTIVLGDGLPLSDLNRGVYVRSRVPTPGAVLVLNAAFGESGARGGLAAVR